MLAHTDYIQQQLYQKFPTSLLALMLHIPIFDSVYNRIDPVYDITRWEVLWANFRLSIPQRDIIYKDHF